MKHRAHQRGFDCLAYKEKAQKTIIKKISKLPVQAQSDYFRQLADSGPLGNWRRSLVRSQRISASR